MLRFQPRFVFMLVLLVLACSLAPAGSSSAQTATETELKRKAEEVDRLKRELERAQSELKKLSTENEQLRREKLTQPPASAAVVETPSRPLAQVPELKADDVIDARDLVLYFVSDPAAAAARFSKKTFRIKGSVQSFDMALFRRQYDVLLESPDKHLKLACGFRMPDQVDSIHPIQRGQVLIAKDGGRQSTLLKVGEHVTIKGRCRGLNDGAIEFSGCEVIR